MNLPDQHDRDFATTAIDRSIMVEAGAGAGKTSILVHRICELVANDVDIRRIAAVTFTESAAGELRDRVRAELDRRAESGSAGAKAAGADLDAAAMGTLHAFARRILAEHPIEAGLPPVVEVLDEVASGVRISRWWSTVRSELLNDESMSEALGVLSAFNVAVNARHRGQGIESLALRLQADWDLVEDRLSGLPSPALPRVDLTDFRRRVDLLAELAETCTDPQDTLLLRVADVLAWGRAVIGAHDVLGQLEVFRARPSVRVSKCGKAGNWGDVAEVRSTVRGFEDLAPFAPLVDAAVRCVIEYLATAVLAAAEQRRREGQLLYHDLLVLSRRMLRRNPHVRQELQHQYPYVLLDEFQDTDPIQIELAVRIAAGAAGSAPDWRDCPVPAGALFVVGDPKQSIYRFRRADIATFLTASDLLKRSGCANLSTNFRSHKQVLDWVNHVFAELIVVDPGVQPEYVPLQPSPLRSHDTGTTRVYTIESDEGKPDAEAVLVADVIATALAQRWPFRDRTLQPSDITVLVPARTSLNALEEALADAGIPYRLMARSLIYGSDEIRDLLMVAAAVDDPSNELLLVEALRSPALGCGDDDLWRWRSSGGTWRLWADPPTGVPRQDPVAAATRFLHDLHGRRRTLSPSELLSAIVAERGLAELAVATGNPRDVWRRYRIVIDQARQWAETAHGSLREYLTWARARAEDEDRTSDVMLPETDSDSVSVMTIHAAKGLEFGVVVLSGMTSPARTQPGQVVWTPTGVEVSLNNGARTLDWDASRADEASRLEAEDNRLLYVACTRAEEYLVVSTVGSEKSRGARLCRAAAGAGHQVWQPTGARLGPLPGTPVPPPPERAEWERTRDEMLGQAARRAAVSAGAVAHREVPEPSGLLPAGLAKDPQDLELPAWLKGRYGTAVGRAVHATLQTVDLSTGAGLVGTAEAQALAEGVPDRAEVVAALAGSALASPVVREAAECVHQKETYVGTEVDGQVVEGFIDLLLVARDGGLVVVDYKTDADPSPHMLEAYRRQLAVYGRALSDATGLEISRRVLVFCRETGGAVEVDV